MHADVEHPPSDGYCMTRHHYGHTVYDRLHEEGQLLKPLCTPRGPTVGGGWKHVEREDALRTKTNLNVQPYRYHSHAGVILIIDQSQRSSDRGNKYGSRCSLCECVVPAIPCLLDGSGCVKSSQVVGLRDRVAIIRTLIFSSPHPYAGSGEVWLR